MMVRTRASRQTQRGMKNKMQPSFFWPLSGTAKGAQRRLVCWRMQRYKRQRHCTLLRSCALGETNITWSITTPLTPHTQHATRHLCAFMSPPERTGGLDHQLAPFAQRFNLRGGGQVSVCGPNRRSAAAPPSPLCRSLGRARLRPRGCR